MRGCPSSPPSSADLAFVDADPLELLESEGLQKRPMQDPDDLVVKKRKKISLESAAKCPSLGDLSSDSLSVTSDFEPTSGPGEPVNLVELLSEEGLPNSDNKVPLDYLLDVLWETDSFRLSIKNEIQSVFPESVNDAENCVKIKGHDHDDDEDNEDDDEPLNPSEAENRIFAKARNAADYLHLASCVIAHFKSKQASDDTTATTAVPQQPLRCNQATTAAATIGDSVSALKAILNLEEISLDALESFTRQKSPPPVL